MAKIDEVLNEMRAVADAAKLEGMARFGIEPVKGLGLNVPQIREIARRTGKNQHLAEQLWATGIHEARVLASMVAAPDAVSRATMDRWTRDFASWDVCDACCYDLFGRTPHAWAMIPKWAGHNKEFVRRAAFSTIAGIAIHDKKAEDGVFLDALPLIEKYAFDDRNFVRKGVNWALRNIGKRNPALGKAAIACAERIRGQNSKAARWIAADALRELRRKYQ
jgi:3-methyladenine DNA glycosylase AlkD